MKTIIPPGVKAVYYHLQCKNTGCAAVLECTLADLRNDSDYTQSCSWEMTCPHCGRVSYFREIRPYKADM